MWKGRSRWAWLEFYLTPRIPLENRKSFSLLFGGILKDNTVAYGLVIFERDLNP